MKAWAQQRKGFTIVELLIVIVVIGVLAAVTIVAYNGIQTRARQAKMQQDISSVRKLVEAYNVENGQYPVTNASLNPNWGTETARTDDNCGIGTSQADWVPGLTGTTLPQSDNVKGVGGLRGCYMYVSDGTSYVISAWNMIDQPQTTTSYRRLGFREADAAHSNQYYTCNHGAIGGNSSGYDAANDYYKHSFTLSNITSAGCDETPPPGA